MLTSLRRICVTGPESTGKTTLALRLARELGTECVPEASRVYADRVARDLVWADVEPIAREHLALEHAAVARVHESGGKVLVLDTDLCSTVVYAEHYYGASSAWLADAARARGADLYLLCDVDVPWIPDGLRDRPADRGAMFQLFREALATRGLPTHVIRGDWDARWTIALRAVQGPMQPML